MKRVWEMLRIWWASELLAAAMSAMPNCEITAQANRHIKIAVDDLAARLGQEED